MEMARNQKVRRSAIFRLRSQAGINGQTARPSAPRGIIGVQARRQGKTPAPPQQIFASSVTPARYGTRPCISPAVIERQQEAIPFGFRTGQRVGDGADRLAGSPDHLKLTVGQNLRNRKGSPGGLGGRIDGNDALGSVETLPEQLLANAGDIGVGALLNSLRRPI